VSSDTPNLRRLVVVKLADLGDVLTATPALRALRNGFPDAEITALVTPHTAPLLRGNDSVDHIVGFPKAWFDDPRGLLRPERGSRAAVALSRLATHLRAQHFDAIVLLHHLTTDWGRAKYRALAWAAGTPIRAGLDDGHGDFLTHRAIDLGFGERHEVDYWLDVVGTLCAAHPEPAMELHLSDDELRAGTVRWAAAALGPRAVVLHPGSGAFSVARRWSPDRFARVGDAMTDDGLQVAVLSGPGEEQLAESVRSAMERPSHALGGIGSPRELGAVLHNAALFIGNDSGVMHMAATVGVPVVGVFGLTNHRAWGPYPPAAHRVVRLDLPCSPCLYSGFELGTPNGCPPRTCLTELEPRQVIAAARSLLQERLGVT
jgi:ADP-heptose:LPS heptosyltransferase